MTSLCKEHLKERVQVSKILIIISSVVFLGFVFLFFYITYDPIYSECIRIKEKLSLDELETKFGIKGDRIKEDRNTLYLSFWGRNMLAAGSIIAVYDKKSKLNERIKCEEDGNFLELR